MWTTEKVFTLHPTHTYTKTNTPTHNLVKAHVVGVRSSPAQCVCFPLWSWLTGKGQWFWGAVPLLRHTVVLSRQRGRKRRKEDEGGTGTLLQMSPSEEATLWVLHQFLT